MNAVVGHGRSVHAMRPAGEGQLSYEHIKCGAGWTNAGGKMVSSKIRLIDHEVTCKRCIKIEESEAIWRGTAPVATEAPVEQAPAPAPVASTEPKLMVSTAGTIHLSHNHRTQSCGMSNHQRYTLVEISADLDWSVYTPAAYPKMFCLNCRAREEWQAAYDRACGAVWVDAQFVAEEAPLGVQLWPTRSPEFAPNFTLDSVAVVRNASGVHVVWTYQNGSTRFFRVGETVAAKILKGANV